MVHPGNARLHAARPGAAVASLAVAGVFLTGAIAIPGGDRLS